MNSDREFFDLHRRPELHDQLTFVDKTGERRSMMWFLHRSKEELVRKRRYHEFRSEIFRSAPAPGTARSAYVRGQDRRTPLNDVVPSPQQGRAGPQAALP